MESWRAGGERESGSGRREISVSIKQEFVICKKAHRIRVGTTDKKGLGKELLL